MKNIVPGVAQACRVAQLKAYVYKAGIWYILIGILFAYWFPFHPGTQANEWSIPSKLEVKTLKSEHLHWPAPKALSGLCFLSGLWCIHNVVSLILMVYLRDTIVKFLLSIHFMWMLSKVTFSTKKEVILIYYAVLIRYP